MYFFKPILLVLGFYLFFTNNVNAQTNTSQTETFKYNLHFELGKKAFNEKDFWKAKDHFDLAYRAQPTNHEILIFRALSKVKMGKNKSACKDFLKAQKLNNPNASKLLAEYCE